MSADDLVRAWKDPDYRTADTPHPAGTIDLHGAGGPAQPQATTVICTIVASVGCSAGLSCAPNCTKTLHCGSCGVFSIGCC